MAELTVPAAQAILAENFAAWVQDLGLTVESVGSGEATLRMPFSERLVRVGGTLCGQALMSAADTAMVIALSVSQNVTFMRPVSQQDVLVEARVLRLGKSLAFGEITLRGANDGKPAAHATTTYAIL